MKYKSIEMLEDYEPTCEQEVEDKIVFLTSPKTGNILLRENRFCHLSSSAFITNKDHTKVLCIYHNIYNSWGWVGGHADGDDDMLYVASKEIGEETSLKNFVPLSTKPIAIDVLPVHSHIKHGKFVNAHTHLNVTYLFEADENNYIHIQEDENSNIAWLTFDELLEKCTEEHMKPVYKKLINVLKTKFPK